MKLVSSYIHFISNILAYTRIDHFLVCFWHYSPWWTLTSWKIALCCSCSCYLHLQFPMPMSFKSSWTDSNHLNLGFYTCRVPSCWGRVSCLQGSSSCILKSFPSQLNHSVFTFQLCLIHHTAYKVHYCIFYVYHYC